MAGYGKKNQGKSGKQESYTKRITQLARDMGAIERGLKNPDSKVSEAYKRGKEDTQR